MEITERTNHDIAIIDLQGRLTTVDDGAQRLRERVGSLFFDGQSKILINLERVPHIDSSGLGELVRCSLIARKANGTLKLFGLTRRVVELMTITKLVTEFETYETEKEAVESCLATAMTTP
jgi:anti-sigma B factor antagonist